VVAATTLARGALDLPLAAVAVVVEVARAPTPEMPLGVAALEAAVATVRFD